MDGTIVRRLGFVDMFVVSVFTGAFFFLILLLYQRAKEHPLNSLLRKAHEVDGFIQKQLAKNLYREDFDPLPSVMGKATICIYLKSVAVLWKVMASFQSRLQELNRTLM